MKKNKCSGNIKIDKTLVEVKLFNSRFISRVLFKPLPLCGIIKKMLAGGLNMEIAIQTIRIIDYVNNVV